MSFQSLADVFAYIPDAPLTSSEVLVLLTIANYTNRLGANAYPSLATLGTMTKLSRRKIQYTLRALEHKQLLTTTLAPGRYGKQTYTLQVPRLALRMGAPDAPLTVVKGAASASKGAPLVTKGARSAPDPIRDPEKEKKAPDDAIALGAGNVEQPPAPTLEQFLASLDAPTIAQLEMEARTSLLAEGVSPWFLIRPVIESRLLELYDTPHRDHMDGIEEESMMTAAREAAAVA